jgi:cystathionine beta-synthase
MPKIYENVLATIGHTPLIKLNASVPKNEHIFLAKVEFFNPGGSVKDRMALAIILDAEKKGLLKPGGTLVEATSGNTGIGLSMAAALKGYKCIFVMPEKISEEKRATLRAYGARVVMTPTGVEANDPRSHYSVAAKFVDLIPGAYLTNQYHNPANEAIHYATTGPELWDQTDGKIDVFVGGAGTGGTISGVGRYLKEKNPDVKIVCADPFGSILHDMFYYKEIRESPHSYLVEGIGEDMMPDNVRFGVMDDFVQVDDRETFAKTRDITRMEGLLVGPSCGAALMAAIKYSESGKLKKPSMIVSMFPDGGRSYLSKAFNDDWMRTNKLADSILTTTTVRDLIEERGTAKDPAGVKVGDSVKSAVHFMREKGLSMAHAFDGGKFAGVLYARDLLAALASGRVFPSEPIFHIVKSSLFEVPGDATLAELEVVFRSERIVRVREANVALTAADLADYISIKENA